VPRSTRVDSPIDEAIASGKGVCQDFAHTMIALLRHIGIPARYVSGYSVSWAAARIMTAPHRMPRTPGSKCYCRI
jgi:transglutaminase-like putative cysteine protease